MGTRAVKQHVLQVLQQDDLGQIQAELAQLESKDLINALFSGICHADERVHWHAVSVMGTAVAGLADRNMEEARIILRRILWSLNDESGGIGWGAPESMAEIMCHHAGLAEEYVHMLISYMRPDGEEEWQDGNFLEHEMLQQGLMWGAGRLSRCRRELVLAKGMDQDLPPYLDSPDAAVRGLAVRATGLLGRTAHPDRVRELAREDNGPVRLYDNGLFSAVSVAQLARQALEGLGL